MTDQAQDRHRLVSGAAALVPLLREHAAETDRVAALPDSVVKVLHESGFFALQAPSSLGGPEADFRTAFEVYTELARGCGSTAWVAMILSGGSFFASLLGEQAREEVWGTDIGAGVCSQLVSTGTARAADGGLVVSGRWATVSGAHQASWALVAVSDNTGESAGGDTSLALVPMSAVSVESTWNVVGLRATRSDTVVIDEVFVPEHRLISLGKMIQGGYGADHPEEPLYGAPVITALGLTLAAPLLGLGRAALEYAVDVLRVETPGAAAKPTGRAGTAYVQFAVADASTLIDTATMHIHRALDDVQRSIETRTQPDSMTQARVHMDAATAAASIGEAVRLLLTAVGTRAFALDNPLQRIWRDVEVASRHAMISLGANRESFGQALLGLDAD